MFTDSRWFDTYTLCGTCLSSTLSQDLTTHLFPVRHLVWTVLTQTNNSPQVSWKLTVFPHGSRQVINEPFKLPAATFTSCTSLFLFCDALPVTYEAHKCNSQKYELSIPYKISLMSKYKVSPSKQGPSVMWRVMSTKPGEALILICFTFCECHLWFSNQCVLWWEVMRLCQFL